MPGRARFLPVPKKAKRGGSPGKGGGGGKASRPFVVAFALTVLLVALAALLWDTYGWDGYTPHVALSGWPAVGALVAFGFAVLAYWRGGKPAVWGFLAAAGVVGLVLAWLTDSLPAPP
jgi:hypothetical protein